MNERKLDFSIPANNQKVIELYNKIKKEELDPNPLYQRKLVWKKQHKYKFIGTILLNFPFPEIYIAPGELNTETLVLKDQIVDGQQRLTTIKNYIDGVDVFSFPNLPIKKFADLSKEEKSDFLNYEISVRYLKNATQEQIRDIFQRINSTEYSLNSTERLNAQWGDSEFICFAKQIIESDLDIDSELINYKLNSGNRIYFLNFFHSKNRVFTEADVNRMLALQYVLTLVATLCEGDYFRRNDRVQAYIESYLEEFPNAGVIELGLLNTLKFIDSLDLGDRSYWFNKANIFSLIIEFYNYDLDSVNQAILKKKLDDVENLNKIYISGDQEAVSGIDPEYLRYFEFAKEAVNDKGAREFRGSFIRKILESSLNATVCVS